MYDKLFKDKKESNVFDFWKDVQERWNIIQIDILQEKQKSSKELLEKHELIFSKIKKENDEFVFENNIFIALIKYIMESNNFFDKRLMDDEIDELLLLAYIYEWICLDKFKDVTLLGDKSEVLKKLKYASNKSKSSNRKIFEDIDIDDITMGVELKRRIKFSVYDWYKKMINFIAIDKKIFLKILKEKPNIKDLSTLQSSLEIWNNIFSISHNGFDYIYSINDSDDKIIYISVEKDNSKIAFAKFKMFYTYTPIEKEIKATGVSKELLRIDFLNSYAQSFSGNILSNCLKVANRVVKNIFLLDLQIRNEEQENHRINFLKSKKVVKIFKMHAKNEEKSYIDDRNLKIKKTLG